MTKPAKAWESYEQVAQHLLNEFAVHFGLGRVEGKQIVPGQSGVSWEIDAKGVEVNGEGFVIIECRRHTTSGLSQEELGGLAYRIQDTKAKGGIVVTPIDLQTGAQRIANYENIAHVKLSQESTTTEYVLSFLDKVFIGVVDLSTISSIERATIEVFEDGKLVEKREYE